MEFASPSLFFLLGTAAAHEWTWRKGRKRKRWLLRRSEKVGENLSPSHLFNGETMGWDAPQLIGCGLLTGHGLTNGTCPTRRDVAQAGLTTTAMRAQKMGLVPAQATLRLPRKGEGPPVEPSLKRSQWATQVSWLARASPKTVGTTGVAPKVSRSTLATTESVRKLAVECRTMAMLTLSRTTSLVFTRMYLTRAHLPCCSNHQGKHHHHDPSD